MTAYVTADITMESIGENETLEVNAYQILFNSTTQEWIWKPLDCVTSRINKTFRVNATVQSNMFTPINGDFSITFKTEETIPELPSSQFCHFLMMTALLAVIVYRRKHST